MKRFLNITLLFLLLISTKSVFSENSDSVPTYADDFETGITEDEVYDPLEPVNRAIFSFNNFADKIILQPVAKGYKKLPSPIQTGISNFLSNLKLPLVIVNQLLQGQGKNAFESSGRFIVNSTAGILGLIDVADKLGLEEKDEDFGQTLATWGVGDGFYLVLPIFGPSN
jgi:Surface lipoprotein